MNPILKRVLTGLVVGLLFAAAVVCAPVSVVAPVCALLAALGLCELFCLLRPKFKTEPVKAFGAFAFFAFFLLALFCVLPSIVARHGNFVLLFVLMIVKFSDVGGFTFGHLSAKLMPNGNHKLCPTVSPGKSWEGLLGSVVFSVAVSCAFLPFAESIHLRPLAHFGLWAAVAFGVAAALLGTAGDLLESKLKRWVGVKDSSTMKITNGLGGFLDMYDSLLLTPLTFFYFL